MVRNRLNSESKGGDKRKWVSVYNSESTKPFVVKDEHGELREKQGEFGSSDSEIITPNRN